jgi:hypothetical protein
MDSASENLSAMTEAYRRVWLTTTYSNMKMLKEILAVNNCDIAQLLTRALTDKKPGRKLRQLGLKNIPNDPKIMESTFRSNDGLCTAFAWKVIVESGRELRDFKIGTNKFHRLAWDDNHILICSAKGKVVTMEAADLGNEGFTDPTLKTV